MPDDAPPKSAYELAMERLRAQDRKAGIAEPKRLTRRQKEAIAELRRDAEAKLAELEIMFDERREAAAGDLEKLAELEKHYEVDRRRVESALEAAVAKEKRKPR